MTAPSLNDALRPRPSEPRPIVCLDLETGGLNPEFHEILSIAAIRLDPHTLEEQARLLVHVAPERPDRVDAKAAQINGYTPEEWARRGAVPLREAMRQLWRIFGGLWKCDAIGHNAAAFDALFLVRAFAAFNQPVPWVLMMDSLCLAKAIGLRDCSLRGMCRAFSVPFDPKAAHDALYDTERVCEILRSVRRADGRRPAAPTDKDRPGVCEHCEAALVWRGRVPLDAASLKPHRDTCPHAEKWSRYAKRQAAEVEAEG